MTTTALAVLAAALLSLALFAGPAAAAEETQGDEATSEGVKGSATGFVYTAIAGVAMGVLVFAMSSPGDIHRADAHH